MNITARQPAWSHYQEKRMKRKKEQKQPKTTKRQKTAGPAFKSNLFLAVKKTGPEKKNIDFDLTFTPSAGTNAFTASQALNIVAQGTTAETRLGRKIVMTSIDLRYVWQLGATSTNGAPARILIVYDKQANAGAATPADILSQNEFNSQMNLANSERFIVLASLITDPISVQNNFSIAGQIYKKIRLETVFNDTNAGTIGDIQTGSVMMIVAQAGAIGTGAPSLIAQSRIRFIDE